MEGTDWASLTTPYGTGASLPETLTRLLDLDPAVRATAAKDALDEVSHQNTIYEATVPVALYVSAILNHSSTAAGELDHHSDPPPRHPTRARLLDWLGATAYDADDEAVATHERSCNDRFRCEYWPMRAFRDLRPAIFSAVQPFLGHAHEEVRDAALVAAIPLAEHPVLTTRRAELADHARRLLATSNDRYKRDRALEALTAWGHDTSALENANDIAARELQARPADPDDWWASNGIDGFSEEPPF
ncbi:hypothetical protein DEJ50_00520 [Streptomyces venezuelae]|uniref:HEAT repeat domain-containing protein n=1 Tax=Streptomyces venezuelae TaxID=54571 RepID=A0A5P2DD65_STRVZ|nr:hypothetical protein DEJ50_00520 [Streptomyces venezuelae]